MTLYRVLGDDSGNGREPEFVPLELWLDNLMNEREILLKRLRYIEAHLVRHKKIKRYSLPQRTN